MIPTGKFTLICTILICIVVAGCGRKTETAPPDTAPGQTPAPGGTANVNVEAIYRQNCASCHGTNLEGKLPGKTNLQKVGSSLTRDQIANQIQNGGNGMPPFKGTLKDEEINALTDWLASKK